MISVISRRRFSRKIVALHIPIVLAGLLILLVVAIFSPVLSTVVEQPLDYGLRLQFAQMMLSGEAVPPRLATPHVLFESLVILIYRVFPVTSLRDAALLIAFAFYIILALVIFGLFVELLASPITYRAGVICIVATLALMLATPITLLSPHNVYFGYIGVNVYHSPTIMLLKPLAVILFFCAGKAFCPLANPGKWLLVASLVSVLAVSAKPSYSVVIVPALVAIACYRQWKGYAVQWSLVIAIGLPTTLALGIQALSYPVAGLVVSPLVVFYTWATLFNPDASAWLLPKFILSILFPVVVYFSYLKSARRDLSLNLAWLCFVIGATYTYLLAEAGRVEFGNITWSGQITLFILFIASLVFFLQQNRWLMNAGVHREGSGHFLLCASVLALHLVSGIVWYLAHSSGMPIFEMQTNLW